MKICVVGGTRFFGIHLVNELLRLHHEVTIATRGQTPDPFGNQVNRIQMDRNDTESVKRAFEGRQFDVLVDDIAYSSNDIRSLLDSVHIDHYVLVSTGSVYEPTHLNIMEAEFDPTLYPLRWLDREEADYQEGKRQAEASLVQHYPQLSHAIVRFPLVIGTDDYTKRLYYYVEHLLNKVGMNALGVEHRISFIRSDEAGKFLAKLASEKISGIFNATSDGDKSVQDIFDFIQTHYDVTPIQDESADISPYSSRTDMTFNNQLAKETGFTFSHLDDWFNSLVQTFAEEILNK